LHAWCEDLLSVFACDRDETPSSAASPKRRRAPKSSYKRVSMINEGPSFMDSVNKLFGHKEYHTRHDDHYFSSYVLDKDHHLYATRRISTVKK
jgi:hypothetical protein